MRKSTVTTQSDSAGPYEIEVFDAEQPKSVMVCAHGNGVRRWDGEDFYYNVAAHYPDHTFLLVDQNQPYKDGCKLNSLDVMVARVQSLITLAKQQYPGVPIIVLAHSMGCGITTELDLDGVDTVVFVAPAAGGDYVQRSINRYGPDVVNGKVVTTSDGLIKFMTKEFMESVKGKIWEDQYPAMLQRFSQVHVYESGDEEIVPEERFKLRDMPFASYTIVPGATHNVHGEALQKFFAEFDKVLP